MSESNYQAPKAPVADPPPPAVALGKRPLSVSLASLLLVLVAIWQLVKMMGANGYEVGVHFFWALTLAPVALMLERGRNWARWMLVGLATLSALSLIAVLAAPLVDGARFVPDYPRHLRHLAAELGLILATVLVFGPGRAWFERPR